jgi:hypothetical protein
VEDRAMVIIMNTLTNSATVINSNISATGDAAITMSNLLTKDTDKEDKENKSNDITSTVYAKMISFATAIKASVTMELESKDE